MNDLFIKNIMSYPEIKGLTKADIKYKLSQMGVSLDRTYHPKDYYVQLYIEQSNAKNKLTRDNTPLYNEQIQIINRKRERVKSTEKNLDEENDDEYDPNNEEEEEYEE